MGFELAGRIEECNKDGTAFDKWVTDEAGFLELEGDLVFDPVTETFLFEKGVFVELAEGEADELREDESDKDAREDLLARPDVADETALELMFVVDP